MQLRVPHTKGYQNSYIKIFEVNLTNGIEYCLPGDDHSYYLFLNDVKLALFTLALIFKVI